MISVEHLTQEFSAKPLFTDISFVVGDRDRIALTGKNGAGKSTLMKIIAGQMTPTSGNISMPRGTTVAYLPQVMELAGERTVIDEALLAFDHIRELQDSIERMKQQMATRTDYETDDYLDLCDRYARAEEHFQLMGGLNFHAEVERTLQGLGFDRTDFDRPTAELSGGWRMRIELAKLLLRQPDVLLLDEPTNHLDIQSIQWLEQYLAQRAAALILVSHDRAFMNNVTNRTIEITCGRIWDYKVKYDEYVRLRAERRAQQLRAYENQQREIADLKEFIERFRYKPTKAVQVQERIKQLARIIPIEVDEVDNSALHLKFPPCQRSGDFPLIIEDLRKAYPVTSTAPANHAPAAFPADASPASLVATAPSPTTPAATAPSPTTLAATAAPSTTPAATAPSPTTLATTAPSPTTPAATAPSPTTLAATAPPSTTPAATAPPSTTLAATAPPPTTLAATAPPSTSLVAAVPSASPEGYHEVIAHVNLTIRRGEKVAFVGRNGEGKSTLVKCILGEIPFEGSLRVGHNAQIGYFAQNQAQLLDPELTVFDTIDRVATGDIRTRIRDILGAFMFGGDAIDKKVKVLSGGERSRLAMIKLLLQPVNFLILDEPTNHLDLQSKDVLKEAIAAFDGTVIVVSHDRQFLDGLVSKVYAFANRRVREHLGGIYDWIRTQQIEQATTASASSSTPSRLSGSSSSSRPAGSATSRSAGSSSSRPAGSATSRSAGSSSSRPAGSATSRSAGSSSSCSTGSSSSPTGSSSRSTGSPYHPAGSSSSSPAGSSSSHSAGSSSSSSPSASGRVSGSSPAGPLPSSPFVATVPAASPAGSPSASPLRSSSPSATVPEASASGSSSSSPSSPRLSYEAQKALARQRRKLEKTVQETETEITETEAAIHLLEDRMSTPEGAADATLYDRHARLKAALEDAEARWLEASEALSNLTSPTS